ncbi:hypothetical protein GCM10010123_45340 [Pilimelia anulata]|uniref:Fibronectin type-III domain-containing protein n=1 Tax=Pilimelia anulata TaxID=53371 RepID=A0A8J3BCT8_9ACTN|nr:fibronectin type III domain-containing protein [Pilimelia anulata]GGK10307.1 hypothetical protein GCM10010123_45340 [Pilimelia anulata]
MHAIHTAHSSHTPPGRRRVAAAWAACRRVAAVVVLTLATGALVSWGSATPAAAATGSDPNTDLYIVGQYNSTLLRIAAGGGETNVGSGLSDPYQLTRASDGSLYIADAGNNRIVRIAADGTQTTAVTGLSYPNAVNIDSNGTIYVGQGNQLLKVVNGVQSTITVSGGVTPYGIAVDPSDNVFVSDYTRNRIIKVTSGGVVSVYATGIAFPTGIVADSNGVVYVTSATAYSVYRIATDGTKTTFATGIQYSWGLAIDGGGNLFASSNGSSSVYKMAPDFPGGNASAIVTGLNSPIGLAVSTVPPAPTVVTGVAGDTKVAVSWTGSATHGGKPITNYTVTSNPGNHTCSTSGATTCEVTGLTNGQAYTFTVTGTNNGGATGRSANSAPSAQVTPAAPGPPTAPASLTVTPANGALDLSFPPAGGGGIIRYEVSVDGGTWTTLTTAGTNPLTGTVSSLTNGTTYGIRVRAVNANGDGAAVGPINGTPRTVPGAPTLQTANPGDTTAELVLTPPSTGGSPITGYQYSTDSGSTWHTLTTSAGTGGTRVGTVSSLTNGTPYTFVVRAVNAAGNGGASGGQTVTPATTPGQPTQLGVVRGDSSLDLTFTPPGNNGGNAITSYQVSTDNGATWSTVTTAAGNGGTRTATVTGLTNGTTYQVRVRAVNGVGAGTASAAEPGTPSTVPGAPTGVSAAAGNNTAEVTFTPPASDGGATIAGYEFSTDGGTTWATSATTAGAGGTRVATLTNLMNGVSYEVRVRAVNTRGNGPASAPASVVPGTPLPPEEVAIFGQTSSLAVTWSAPHDNGVPITGYTAYASPGLATCTADGDEHDCVLGGVAGTSYTVTVVAHASGMNSVPSAASNAAIPTAPAVPTTPPETTLLLTTEDGDISTAEPGQEIVVLGEGFAPYSTVSITLYSAPVVLGNAVANGSGSFRKAVIVPTSLAAGVHTIIASGVDPDGNPHSMKLVVTVAGAATADELPVTSTRYVGELVAVGAGWLLAGLGLYAAAGWLRRRSALD